MARTPSLRSIPQVPGVRPRTPGWSQVSPAGERVRLEGERARLEQEIAAWRRNESRAAARLRLVEERLAALSGDAPAAAPASGLMPDTPPELDGSPRWAGFTLEY